MSNQAAETSVTYKTLLAYAVGLDAPDILWGPSYTIGTRIWLRDKNGFWRAYLVTDLLGSPATQPVSGTVTANQGSAQPITSPWPVQLSDGLTGDTPVIVNAQPAGSFGVNVHIDGLDSVPVSFVGGSAAVNVQRNGLLAGVTGLQQDNFGGGRTETIAASTAGTSDDMVTGVKYHALLVTSPPATWDVRLEGSIDNANFTQILAHTNADGAGVTKFSAANACRYIRSRRADAIAGNATITRWSNP